MSKGFADRMVDAHSYFLWTNRQKSLSQEALAERVSAILGKPVGQPAAGRWFRSTVPDTKTIEAIAQVYGVDPGWLAFGAACKAPAPFQQITDSPEDARAKAMELVGRMAQLREKGNLSPALEEFLRTYEEVIPKLIDAQDYPDHARQAAYAGFNTIMTLAIKGANLAETSEKRKPLDQQGIRGTGRVTTPDPASDFPHAERTETEAMEEAKSQRKRGKRKSAPQKEARSPQFPDNPKFPLGEEEGQKDRAG